MRRTLFPHAALSIATAILLLNGPAFGNEPAPDVEGFRRLHSLIKPKASEESWIRIPWMTSLWEARQRAAGEGKPILLWEMDGHPLGCT